MVVPYSSPSAARQAWSTSTSCPPGRTSSTCSSPPGTRVGKTDPGTSSPRGAGRISWWCSTRGRAGAPAPCTCPATWRTQRVRVVRSPGPRLWWENQIKLLRTPINTIQYSQYTVRFEQQFQNCFKAVFNCFKAVFNCFKAIFNCFKAVFNCSKTAFNCFKAVFNCFKAVFNCFEAAFKCSITAFNCFKAVFNCFKAVFNCFKAVFNCFKVVFNCFKAVFNCFKAVFNCFQKLFQFTFRTVFNCFNLLSGLFSTVPIYFQDCFQLFSFVLAQFILFCFQFILFWFNSSCFGSVEQQLVAMEVCRARGTIHMKTMYTVRFSAFSDIFSWKNTLHSFPLSIFVLPVVSPEADSPPKLRVPGRLVEPPADAGQEVERPDVQVPGNDPAQDVGDRLGRAVAKVASVAGGSPLQDFGVSGRTHLPARLAFVLFLRHVLVVLLGHLKKSKRSFLFEFIRTNRLKKAWMKGKTNSLIKWTMDRKILQYSTILANLVEVLWNVNGYIFTPSKQLRRLPLQYHQVILATTFKVTAWVITPNLTMDYSCDDGWFWVSTQECQLLTRTVQKLRLE